MQSQVELLATIRELALKSANGVYSDSDRAIMQKEVNQRLTEIDDIAVSTNYNGRPFLNQAELEHTDTTFIPGYTAFDSEAAETLNTIDLVPETPNQAAVRDGIMCYMPPTSYLALNNGQTVYDANSFTYNAMSFLPGIGSTVYDAAGGRYTVVDADTTGTGLAIPAIEYPTGNTPPSYIPLDITAGTPAMPSVGASGFLPHTKNYQVLGTVGTGGSAAVTKCAVKPLPLGMGI